MGWKSLIGAVVGWFVGGPVGYVVGSFLGGLFEKPKGPKRQPALTDVFMPTADYGSPISFGHGEYPTGTTPIWKMPLPPIRIMTATEEHPGRPDEYYHKWAVVLTKGPVKSVPRMCLNGMELYNLNDTKQDIAGEPIWNEAGTVRVGQRFKFKKYGTVSIYFGSEDQDPDQVMAYYEGYANTPAYRGWCYAVFHAWQFTPGHVVQTKGFRITPFGNAIPTVTADIVQATDATTLFGWEELEQSEATGTTIGVMADYSIIYDTTYGFANFEVGQIIRASGFLNTAENDGQWKVTDVSPGENIDPDEPLIELAIVGVVTGAGGTFSVAGNYLDWMIKGSVFDVDGSTGNDKRWTVSSVSYDGVDEETDIVVTGIIPDATVDGVVQLMPDPVGFWIKVAPEEGQVMVDEMPGEMVTVTGAFDDMDNQGIAVRKGNLWMVKPSGATAELWYTTDCKTWKKHYAPPDYVDLSRCRLAVRNDTIFLFGGGADEDERMHAFNRGAWMVLYPSGDDIPLENDVRDFGICVAPWNGEQFLFDEQDQHFLFTGGRNGATKLTSFYLGYVNARLPAFITWTPLNDDCGIGERAYHSMVYWKHNGVDEVYVIGGDAPAYSNGVYILEANNTFTQLTGDLTGGAPNGSVVDATVYKSGLNEYLVALVNNTDTGLCDVYYSSDGTTWAKMDIASGTIPASFDSNGLPGFAYFNGHLWLFGGARAASECNTVLRLDEIESTASTKTLASIISDISDKAGLETTDIDVTDPALTTTEVRGVIWRDVYEARSLIEDLQRGFFFDWYESMGLIQFKSRGRPSIRTLTAADLAYRPEGQNKVDKLFQSRSDVQALPRELQFLYYDSTIQYQQNQQSAFRTYQNSKGIFETQVPIIMTPDEAAQKAEILIDDAHNEQRPGQIYPRMRHCDLDPTDVVALYFGEIDVDARIKALTFAPNNLLEAEVVVESLSSYSSTRAGVAARGYRNPKMGSVSPIHSYLLDIPLLRPEDNHHGFYIAVIPDGDALAYYNIGGELWRSRDYGETFDRLWSSTITTIAGTIDTALAGGVDHHLMDELNSFVVQVENGSLLSIERSQLLSGANLAFIGNPDTKEYEIIQFQTVSRDGLQFTCSNLLRGLYGTENFIDSHVAGETFILIRDEANGFLLGNVSLDAADLDRTYTYKSVPFGSFVEEIENTQSLYYQGRRLRHGPPARLTWIYRFWFIIHWRRSDRSNAEFWNTVFTQVDDSHEEYELVLLDGADGNEIYCWTESNPMALLWQNTFKVLQASDIILKTDLNGNKPYSYADITLSRNIYFRFYQISNVGRGEAYDFEVHT